LRSRTIAPTAQSLGVRLSRRVTAYEPEPSPKREWLLRSSNSYLEEEADDSLTAQAWDKFLSKKVLELAARMVTVAQAHSELHRRMTSEKLNQANRPFDDSQLQVSTKGRKTEASLRLPAQLPISHEKLDTIEDEMEGSSLKPNLFTRSQEIL
jgi:hypothetical protein